MLLKNAPFFFGVTLVYGVSGGFKFGLSRKVLYLYFYLFIYLFLPLAFQLVAAPVI